MSLDFAPQPKYHFKVFSHRFRPSWMLEAGVEPSRRASPIFCCRSFLVFAFFSSDFFVQGEVSFVRQIKTLLFLCYVRIGAHEVMVVFFDQTIILGKTSIKKKRFLSGIARIMGGGGLPMPEFFGPLFRSVFLVNKKSLFLQKCQCIELLTVF